MIRRVLRGDRPDREIQPNADLGDYAAHMHWFAVREREKDNLAFMPMELRDRPDYWNVLRNGR
jgi:hypothetical protein